MKPISSPPLNGREERLAIHTFKYHKQTVSFSSPVGEAGRELKTQ
jgi:hypothetical protein